MLTRKHIAETLRTLGLRSGDCVYLKVTMRQLGAVENGARGLLDAVMDVLGDEGTLVCSSFITMYSMAYLTIHPRLVVDEKTPSYAGAAANEILRYPGVCRSPHPIQKFAAVGKRAAELVDDHDANSYAYDVFRKMAESGGKTLKIGSDETVPGAGTSHVAVGLLGFRQKRPYLGVRYRDKDGKRKRFIMNWAGLCRQGFHKFDALYDAVPGAVIARGKLGNAPVKLTDMGKTLKAEMDVLSKDPRYFMCDDPRCGSCRITWEFSDETPMRFFLRSIFTLQFSNVNYLFKNYLLGQWLPPRNIDEKCS